MPKKSRKVTIDMLNSAYKNVNKSNEKIESYKKINTAFKYELYTLSNRASYKTLAEFYKLTLK